MDKCSLVKVSKTSVNDRVEWTDSINSISYCHHLKYRAGWVNHHNAACKISSFTQHTLDSLKQVKPITGFFGEVPPPPFCRESPALEFHPLRYQVMDLLKFHNCGKACVS